MSDAPSKGPGQQSDSKPGLLARALSSSFLKRLTQPQEKTSEAHAGKPDASHPSHTGHSGLGHHAKGEEDPALKIWKAAHGHGGHRPTLPQRQLPPSQTKKPAAKPAPGKRGKVAKVQPKRHSIIIVEKPTASLPSSSPRHGGHSSAPTPVSKPGHGSPQKPTGKTQPPAPPTPSPIINPFAGWSQKDVKDRIRQLLGDVEVPRFRKAVFETLRRLRDPDTTPEKVMEVMAIDAQLVSKVMQTVNSTAYSPRSKIQSLDHAIMLMGNADLERIVMLVGAKAALPSQTHPKFGLSDFWKVSSRRAVLAREVADLVQPSKANLSFTAGFLQDLSVPLIVSSKKDDYMKIFTTAVEEKRDLHLLETESMGWDHAEVGALIALDWELPDDVMLCLKDHNHPEATTRPDSAHYVSSLLPSHGEEWHDQFAAKIDQRYTVPREVVDTICKDSVAKANELAKLF